MRKYNITCELLEGC